MKIIQIDGFKGLITAAFIGVCLFAGFVVFPGLVAMHLWNKYLVELYMFPVLNLLQGVLLWGIVAISYCILSKKGLAVSFKDTPELSDRELDMIMKRARIQSQLTRVNRMIQKSDSFESKSNISINNNDKELSHMSSPVSLANDKAVDKKDDEAISNLK